MIFLSLFSYLLLTKFEYYDPDTIDLPSNCTQQLENITMNITNLTQFGTSNSGCKEILKPSWLEYLLCFWVFSFFCQELGQVSKLFAFVQLY